MAESLFRALNENEVEVRRGDFGSDLLIYKDARADMALLDETVGPFGWKKEYPDKEHCMVSLWDPDKKEWVSKMDAGDVTSKAYPSKSLASDAFKRACSNWGIGRELYTAPKITYPTELVDSKRYNTYKVLAFEREADGKSIAAVTIAHFTDGIQSDVVRFAHNAVGGTDVTIVSRNVVADTKTAETKTPEAKSSEIPEKETVKAKADAPSQMISHEGEKRAAYATGANMTMDTEIKIGDYKGKTMRQALESEGFKEFLHWVMKADKTYDDPAEQAQYDYFVKYNELLLEKAK